MKIPYTNFCLARNKDNSLCIFDDLPKNDNGKWYVYHNGERDYGYKLNYTNPICDFITMKNSPYIIDVNINPYNNVQSI